MKSIISIIISVSISLSGESLIDEPITSEGDIIFYLDHAAFRGLDSKTLNEFYLSSFTDQYYYNIIDTNFYAQLKLTAEIKDYFGNSHFFNSWITDVRIDTNQKVSKNLVFYDQWAVNLMPGKYIIFIELRDIGSRKTGVVNEEIVVKGFNKEIFEISDIEFVSNVNKLDRERFKKGNLYIKPNPWRRYGVLNPTLYIYFELYNTATIKSDSILINYSIIDSYSKKYRRVSISKLILDNNSTVLNGIDVSNLPSGIYSLEIEIQNDSYNNLLNSTERFEVIQPDYIKLASNSNQVVDILDKISAYIMTIEELNSYELLADNKKILFINDFIKSKDHIPSTDENEYLQSLIRRYKYAQKNFAWSNRDGFKSDRGRIVIVYGLPDEVEEYTFEEESFPYQIWKYHQDREFSFVFCDLRSDGRYTLLHSTKEGEIYNPSWYSEVKR